MGADITDELDQRLQGLAENCSILMCWVVLLDVLAVDCPEPEHEELDRLHELLSVVRERRLHARFDKLGSERELEWQHFLGHSRRLND